MKGFTMGVTTVSSTAPILILSRYEGPEDEGRNREAPATVRRRGARLSGGHRWAFPRPLRESLRTARPQAWGAGGEGQ